MNHVQLIQRIILSMSLLTTCIPLRAQAEEAYIGYASEDYAFIENGQGVQKYYVVEDNIFNSSLDENSVTAASKVAYCFNYHNVYPSSFKEGGSGYVLKSDVLEEEFASAVGNSSSVEKEELYSSIVRLARIGYPYDQQGIQKQYGLDDDTFRFLTQYAIWYYTDSIELVFQDAYYNIYQFDPKTNEKTCLSMDQSVPLDYSYKEEMKLAYQALLESTYSSTDVSSIDLYRGVNETMQCLLTVAFTPQKETKTASLTIQKKVDSSAVDLSQAFSFEIRLFDTNRQPVNASYPLSDHSILTFEDGLARVSLKHGESITILSLEEGTYYEIKETETDGYEIKQADNASNLETGPLKKEDAIVCTFVNRKKANYEATLKAKKILVDHDLGKDAFTFVLEDAYGNKWEETNDENGDIAFPTFSYEELGIYTYTMYEKAGSDTNITYDSASKQINVIVGDRDLVQVINREDLYLKEEDGHYLFDSLSVYPLTGETSQNAYCSILVETKDDYSTLVKNDRYGDALETTIRKLLYFQQTHAFEETMIPYGNTEIAFEEDLFQQMLRYVGGESTFMDQMCETLIKNILLETEDVPQNFSIVLLTDGTSGLIAGRMNEVTVESAEEIPTFTNTYHEADGELSLTKTVRGSAGETDRAFHFNIEIKDFNGDCEAVKKDSLGNESAITLEWKEGKTGVALKHDESLILKDLPSVFSYVIQEEESNEDGYQTTSLKDPLTNEMVNKADVVVCNQRDIPTYSFTIRKVNENNERMEGVGFYLYEDEACEKLYEEEMLSTNRDGEILLYGLKEGNYYLKEVKTKEGYALLEEAILLEVPKKTSITITNHPKEFHIPDLGDQSDIYFKLFGLIGMIVLAILLIQQRQEKK